MKNKFGKKTAAIAAGVLCVSAVSGALIGCNNDDTTKNSIVALDINPGIEIVLDKKDKVVGIYGTNEDGLVLLYGETEGIVGMTFEKAIDRITSAAVEYGYLSEDNKVVQYTVTSSISGADIRLNGIIDKHIDAAQSELGLSFKIESDSEVAFAVQRKFEAFTEAHPEYKNKLDIKDFSMALSLSENPETGVTLEAAVKLDRKELVTKLAAASEMTQEYATAAYNAAKAEASRIYDSVAAAAVESAYAEFYLKNITKYPTTAYLGSLYSAYRSSARNLDAIADAADCAAKAAGEVLDSEQTKAVLAALGMTEEQIDELKDSEGRITVESVDAYANKKFKNSEASAALETAKTELKRALNTAESAIKAAAEQVNEEYADEIADIKEAASSIVSALENASALLPESVKTVIADMKSAVNKMTELVSDGVTVSDLRELADFYEEKANAAEAEIKNNLTKAELEQIETRKAEIENTFSAAKEKMNAAVQKAEQAARERLQQLKDARKTK